MTYEMRWDQFERDVGSSEPINQIKKDIEFLRRDVSFFRWLISSMELRYRFFRDDETFLKKVDAAESDSDIKELVEAFKERHKVYKEEEKQNIGR